MNKWIVITGPTASGKTRVAVDVAVKLDGEIVSADSRQVYRGLDIGTGKDLEEYQIKNVRVPYHMIDIATPQESYHIARFQTEAFQAIQDIEARNKLPILCGGSGLYLESLLEGSCYIQVGVNEALRASLEELPIEDLQNRYARGQKLNFSVDTHNRKRLIRAIEIQASEKAFPENRVPDIPVFLLAQDRTLRRKNITQRLKKRLKEGLIEEVESLRKIYEDDILIRLGLEYKFVTLHLAGELTRDEMQRLLETAIHQFAKRQMTWFRRMERKGYQMVYVPDSVNAADFITDHWQKC